MLDFRLKVPQRPLKICGRESHLLLKCILVGALVCVWLCVVFVCLACLEAFDHQNKSSNKRQSMFLYISKANLDQPGTS